MKPTIVPFVKWVGGKRQLSSEIGKIIDSFKEINRYHEPFVGGGAIFLKNLSKGIDVGTINDLNSELINCYEVIKDSPEILMDKLNLFGEKHCRMLFYAIRFMDRDGSLNKKTKIFRAARFIYLNKTSFNGIYRVNLKDQLNVPIGSIGPKKLYLKENILKISKGLSDIKIFNSDYKYIKNEVVKGDLVYFDPPYDSFENQNSFVGYQKEGFTKEDQKELKRTCDFLISKGVNVVVSNHNTKFINDLYKDPKYYIKKVVKAARTLNSDSKNRAKKDIEIIIYSKGEIYEK